MTTNNVTNVSAGKPKVGGAIFRAPLGTALPTNATSDLSDAYKNLGYVTDDGVTNGVERNTDEEKAWGGDTVNTLQTDYNDTFDMSLLEILNKNVLETVVGDDNVSGDLSTGLVVKFNSAEAVDAVYVIDMVLRNGALKRIVIPIGRAVQSGDINYKDDECAAYPITITAQTDSAGNTHYEYMVSASSDDKSGD